MRNNIFILDKLAKKGQDQFCFEDINGKYEICDKIEDADAIILRSSSLHEQTFSDNLSAIARAGAGVNNIPIERCSESGIVVFNTPGANANSVKELVFCSLLLASRDILGGIEWVKSLEADDNISKAVEKGKKAFAGNEIKGKTLGVIGLGAIGIEVANTAISLGMKVCGYDPYLTVGAAFKLSSNIVPVNDINKLLSESDYITIHVPLSKDSDKLLNADKISHIKEGAVLLNFSRDVLVDEKALSEALENGKVRRYITDFANKDSVKMKNCIVIPHLGASTVESEENCAYMAAIEIKDYIENGNIKNSVNYPNCDMGVCRSEGRIALLHKNIPNMIGQISAILGKYEINIADLTNKSRDKVAYTLIDIESKLNDALIAELNNVEGVLRVRVVK